MVKRTIESSALSYMETSSPFLAACLSLLGEASRSYSATVLEPVQQLHSLYAHLHNPSHPQINNMDRKTKTSWAHLFWKSSRNSGFCEHPGCNQSVWRYSALEWHHQIEYAYPSDSDRGYVCVSWYRHSNNKQELQRYEYELQFCKLLCKNHHVSTHAKPSNSGNAKGKKQQEVSHRQCIVHMSTDSWQASHPTHLLPLLTPVPGSSIYDGRPEKRPPAYTSCNQHACVHCVLLCRASGSVYILNAACAHACVEPACIYVTCTHACVEPACIYRRTCVQ